MKESNEMMAYMVKNLSMLLMEHYTDLSMEQALNIVFNSDTYQKVLNETKKVGNAGWLSTKEIANRVAAWINEDIADLQRTLIIELQVLIVFAIAYAAKTYPRKFSKNQEAAMRKIFNEELEKHLNRGKSGVVQAN